FWMPPQQRSYVAGTGTLGGMVVQTGNLGGEFIEMLRNAPMVERLGARVLNLSTPVTIPRQSGAGVANWVGESVAATLAAGNFEQLTLTPYGVSAFQQYSKQLLYTSNPSIDMVIQDDINQIIALAIDRAALHGTGSGQPTGIAATTGIGTVSVAMLAASALSSTLFPFMVSLETAISSANADGGSVAFLVNAKTRSALKSTLKFAVNGSEPIWENPSTPGGFSTIAGWRAETSNQISTNLTAGTAAAICTAIFAGNWNDLLLAKFNGGATDIVVDPFSLAQNAVVRVIARSWVDIGVRHAASFAIGGGIIA
ncbi:MAG: phage major capsid protein, partial [Verrucomicrobiota bacterium]